MISGLMPNRVTRSIELHHFQKEAVDATEKAWADGMKRPLVVLPMGSGKTCVSGELAARRIEKGQRVLMVAHTRKLVDQYCMRSEKDFGIYGTVESGIRNSDWDSPLVCSTVQTMSNRLKSGKFKSDEWDLIIMDESHRALSPVHQSIAKACPNADVLGITATPRRGDQKDLMKFFDAKVYDLPLSQLIEWGYLSPIVIRNIPLRINLTTESKSGDYSEEEVAHAIRPYLEAAADELVKHGKGRCCLVFLPLIEISKDFCKMLKERGMKAEHVDGTMKERDIKRVVSDLERGDVQCVCNSMLLTEGVDIRPVNLILNLRATRSWTLYLQSVGRGTRTFDPSNLQHNPHGEECSWPLKTECILLDPLWQCEQHSLLQRPSTLFAEDEAEADAIDAELEAQKDEADDSDAPDEMMMLDLLAARDEARRKREETLRERLEAMAHREAREVSAMDLFAKMGRYDLADYEATSRYELEAMTPGQRKMLMDHGVDLTTIHNKGMASKVVEQIFQRQKMGLATIKMCKFGEALHMQNVWLRPFEEVRAFLNLHKSGGKPFANLPV